MPTRERSLSMLPLFVRGLKNTVCKIPGHSCTLPLVDEPVHLRVSDGLFVQCRRKVWNWITIDSASIRSQQKFKSQSQIYNEKIRHLNYNVIHPFSKFRICWEGFMIPIWIISLIILPTAVAIGYTIVGVSELLLICSIICLIDIILWFFTGYYNSNQNTVVLQSKRIVKHYLLTFFIFDFISSIPIPAYSLLQEYTGVDLSGLILIKIVRLPRLLDYLQRFSEKNNFLVKYRKIIGFMLTLTILFAWGNSLVFILFELRRSSFPSIFKDNDPASALLLTAFNINRLLLLIGSTTQVNIYKAGLIVRCVGVLVGAMVGIFVLAKINQFYNNYTSSLSRYKMLRQEIHHYTHYKQLPPHLKAKIYRYVDYKSQRNIFREEDLLDNLSKILKNDVMLHRCHSMIDEVELFKGLPINVVTELVSKLRGEIYLPNDAIVLSGQTAYGMHFINQGTAAVYSANGQEVRHLEDGSHFGEAALIIKGQVVTSVIAVTECEVFFLSRKDFHEIISSYPHAIDVIEKTSATLMENFMKHMLADEDNTTSFK